MHVKAINIWQFNQPKKPKNRPATQMHGAHFRLDSDVNYRTTETHLVSLILMQCLKEIAKQMEQFFFHAFRNCNLAQGRNPAVKYSHSRALSFLSIVQRCSSTSSPVGPARFQDSVQIHRLTWTSFTQGSVEQTGPRQVI